MNCSEAGQLRAAYIARDLAEDYVQEILSHLDICQPCHEAYLDAIGAEVVETLQRGPAVTRHLTTEEIEDERIRQMRRSARSDVLQPWPMEDFNYLAFRWTSDPGGTAGWWVSRRARPLERAAWAVTLVLPEGRRTRSLLLLLSLGGLYDWESVPALECPVRYRKPPAWFLAGRAREPLAPIWGVLSVSALLARLRVTHGRHRLRRAAQQAERRWLSRTQE